MLAPTSVMERIRMIKYLLITVALFAALVPSSRGDQDSAQVSDPVISGLVKVAEEI